MARSADTLDRLGIEMSFRTRLTSFFVLIVIVPMVAIGIMVFRLISQSEQGKIDARATGIATAATSLYASDTAAATADAKTIARSVARLNGASLEAQVRHLANQSGLARVTVTRGTRRLLDIGSQTAIAPGFARGTIRGAAPIGVEVSELTATDLARQMSGPGVGVVVQAGPQTLASTAPAPIRGPLPRRGTISVSGTKYRALTQRLRGFDGPIALTVLSSVTATGGSVTGSQLLAAGFLVTFLLLALLFAVLASRQLQGQIRRFLYAARRLGKGDFSSPVPIEGHDEFAALGDEFNQMSRQLSERLEELAQERARLRTTFRWIGEIFASNLDRDALLELALRTAVDAVQGQNGRLTARETPGAPLAECAKLGSLAGLEPQVLAAERAALKDGEVGQAGEDGIAVVAVRVGKFDNGAAHAVISVGRRGPEFTADDIDVLRSLASQAALALENVELHHQVSRQAVTDELTGLNNHRRFQEILDHELEEVRRYRHPLALIMLDIDNFKSVNDTYGHPQGDLVLNRVAQVLQASSRELDVPARYGGEEMALILPHTDLEGAYVIAERVRSSVETIHVPRVDGQGNLRVTVSVGVASSSGGDKESLVAEADAALYEAKRGGKNQTVKAEPQAANVFGGE